MGFAHGRTVGLAPQPCSPPLIVKHIELRRPARSFDLCDSAFKHQHPRFQKLGDTPSEIARLLDLTIWNMRHGRERFPQLIDRESLGQQRDNWRLLTMCFYPIALIHRERTRTRTFADQLVCHRICRKRSAKLRDSLTDERTIMKFRRKPLERIETHPSAVRRHPRVAHATSRPKWKHDGMSPVEPGHEWSKPR